MRGARAAYQFSGLTARIIPADAGSTADAASLLDVSRDHPRGCGEHYLDHIYLLNIQGSSPRMRGAPDSLCKPIPRVGIIPADAGST